MRLLDQVGQASAPLLIEDGRGWRTMPGCADRAAAVRACPLRYVLEPDVVAVCRELRWGEGVAPPDLALRVPAACFWMEWAEADGLRTGVLITGDDDGSSATIEVFWEQARGDPDRAQVTMRFDRNGTVSDGGVQGTSFALRPGDHPLAPYLYFDIERIWLDHFGQLGRAIGIEAIGTVVKTVVVAAEMVFAFAILLSARTALETSAVDRARLNRARRGAGKAALLDHVEVRLSLGRELTAYDGNRNGHRQPARLHQVRGHFVERAGQVLWRRSHARGTAAPIVTRTVRVGLYRRPPNGSSPIAPP